MSNIIPDGKKIEWLRRALEISQRKLAKRAGMSDSYLSLFEQGRSMSDQQLERIEAALGFTLSDPRVEQLFSLVTELQEAANAGPR